jgi:hypothetical protein
MCRSISTGLGYGSMGPSAVIMGRIPVSLLLKLGPKLINSLTGRGRTGTSVWKEGGPRRLPVITV